MDNIKIILENGELIKIDNDLFIFAYGPWTLKLRSDDERRFAGYLYYNGIYLITYMIDKNKINLLSYNTI